MAQSTHRYLTSIAKSALLPIYKSMRYVVGLLVFSGIGSFLISDTITFWRDLRKSNRYSHLLFDFFRLLILASMALIGYAVASRTFQKPNDWIIFLLIGVIGAFLTHILTLVKNGRI